jgi:hypothetical protein
MSAVEQMTVLLPAVNLVSPAVPVIEAPFATATPFSVSVAAKAAGARTKAAKAAIRHAGQHELLVHSGHFLSGAFQKRVPRATAQ